VTYALLAENRDAEALRDLDASLHAPLPGETLPEWRAAVLDERAEAAAQQELMRQMMMPAAAE
jgi:hypothetical protein